MSFNDLISHPYFSPRTVLGICISTGTAMLITLIYSIWQWQNDWVLAHQDIEVHAVAAGVSTAGITNSINESHLFGKAPSQLGNMPITNLQLRVTGIVKMDTDRSGPVSKAYISTDGQPSKIYQVGESLPSGVKVYDITPNEVILENDGNLEKLPLPREQLQFKPKLEEHK